MTAAEALLVLVAGLGAGTINAVIGSGTLITFPVLLAAGYPPVVANVTNNVGLVPGSITAVHGWRRELRGRWRPALGLAAGSAAGSLAGSLILLSLPESSFEVVVPVLIAGALGLVVLQPRITAAVRARRRPRAERRGGWLRAGVLATGVYGGYFGAAQGILLFALLGTSIAEQQHANALRNLLAGTANATAAVVFLAVADVALAAAGLLAAGAAAGGMLGARVGRRLSPPALRAVVVAVGLAAIARLVL